MSHGEKSSTSNKQKRKTEAFENGYQKQGGSDAESDRRGWASANKRGAGDSRSSGKRRHWLDA